MRKIEVLCQRFVKHENCVHNIEVSLTGERVCGIKVDRSQISAQTFLKVVTSVVKISMFAKFIK